MNNRRNEPNTFIRKTTQLLFFPAVIFYMELIFHVYMGLGLKYIPIYLCFSVSTGCVCALFTNFFPVRINQWITCILLFLSALIFSVEMICKTVLAQYYQLASAASTAANNRLTDYTGAIMKGILMNLPGIILMFIPLFIIAVLFMKHRTILRCPSIWLIPVFASAVIFHLLGIACVFHLPYNGNITPHELYQSDTDIEEQVRQLGLLTMLRLDIKHRIFGVDRELAIDREALDQINTLTHYEDTSDTAETSVETETDSPPIDTSPNIIDLDFEGLSRTSSDESVLWLNNYFSGLEPTKKNEYTGMFKGYNVIFITAEGFSGYMIDEDLTPTLYKLTHEGFVFNNFYTPLHYTSTSGGECQNLLGLYPKNGEPRTMAVVGTRPLDVPFTLANQLNRLGYTSIGYHFNGDMYTRRLSHPQLGYEWQDSGQLTMETADSGSVLWPQSDEYMITSTFEQYVTQEPFNIYYLTISGHMPYSLSSNAMTQKNYDTVAGLPYSEDTKYYIAANLELEKGLSYLIQRLEETGLADRTLIVMAPDHIPYFSLPVLEELAGETFGSSEDAQRIYEENMNFEVYRNSLIIWSASMEEPVSIDKVCCQVDILPTLSNLLGLEYDSRLLEGSDILSDSEGLVIFSSKSWQTDLGFYNSYSGLFTPAKGNSMDITETESYVRAMNTAVDYKLQATTLIQDTDYYSLILPDIKKAD